MIIRAFFFVMLGLLVGGVQAGAKELPSIFSEEGQQLLMGPLAAVGDTASVLPSRRVRKSAGGSITPRRAFLSSLLVPGSGQFFAGAKKRGAIFLGLEVVTLGLYFSWNGEGKDLEKKFRAVADANWSPENYLAWRGSTISKNSPELADGLPCEEYINDYLATGGFGGCSAAEVQQYYELIGKYNHFVSGWVDIVDKTGNSVRATEVDSVENFLSVTRLDYEVKRDDSNKLLKRASALSGVIMINHVISAIDAARVARRRAEGVATAVLERRTRFAFVMQQGSRHQVPMLMAYKPFD